MREIIKKKEVTELNRESNLMGQEKGLSNPGGLDFMNGFYGRDRE